MSDLYTRYYVSTLKIANKSQTKRQRIKDLVSDLKVTFHATMLKYPKVSN